MDEFVIQMAREMQGKRKWWKEAGERKERTKRGKTRQGDEESEARTYCGAPAALYSNTNDEEARNARVGEEAGEDSYKYFSRR
jgi:hypothetical protein